MATSVNIVPETLEDMRFWEQFYPRGIDKKKRFLLTHPDYQKRHWQKLKIEVLAHYSGGALVCVRCGFDDLRALSLDHIDGNGRKDRADPKYNASKFYISLRRMDYPEGFQTLCMNCQYIKRVENNELSKARKANSV